MRGPRQRRGGAAETNSSKIIDLESRLKPDDGQEVRKDARAIASASFGQGGTKGPCHNICPTQNKFWAGNAAASTAVALFSNHDRSCYYYNIFLVINIIIRKSSSFPPKRRVSCIFCAIHTALRRGAGCF